MPLGIFDRQLAPMGAVPSIDKAAAHVVDCPPDMDLQLMLVLLTSLSFLPPPLLKSRSADSGLRSGSRFDSADVFMITLAALAVEQHDHVAPPPVEQRAFELLDFGLQNGARP